MAQGEILRYLLLDLAIIIVAARACGAAARRLGQPAVIGEILAGILLGPTVLGRINPDWPSRVFPAAVPLRAIADLGLVFFMFLVGLDLDTDLIRRQGRHALQVSLAGIGVPLVGGVLVGVLMTDVNAGGIFIEGTAGPPDRLPFALFVGAAMCITAFPVLARIVTDTGLAKTAVGTIALCAAAVDDVVAWVLLAAVVGITNTGSALEAGRALLLTALFVAGLLTAGRHLLAFILQSGSSRSRSRDASGRVRMGTDRLALLLATVLLCAYLTELIGIHAIFGAFMVGAVLPRQGTLTRELMGKVQDLTVLVLLPVFFAVVGLRTNVFTLSSPALLGWLLLILTVAIAGKLGGCSLAARCTGAAPREALVIGALMNTRGLTELVILTVGLNLGVLSDRTFAMMVIMALTTTVMAAPLVNRLMRGAPAEGTW